MTTLFDQFQIGGTIRLNPIDIGVIERVEQHGVLVLPSASIHKKQKIVIGSLDGQLSCYTVSKAFTLENTWRTSTQLEKPVLHVSLGGLKPVKDQIYVVCGDTVVGVRKAGNPFFKFPGAFPDLQHVLVDLTHLHCFSRASYSLFNQTTRVFSHTFSADIISQCLLSALSPRAPAVICCADGCIRVLSAVPLPPSTSPVIAEHRPLDTPTVVVAGVGRTILYGGASGSVGCLALLSAADLEQAGEVPPPHTPWVLRELWTCPLPWLAGASPSAPACVVAHGSGARVLSAVSALAVGGLLECTLAFTKDNVRRSVEVAVGTVDGTVSVLRVPVALWPALSSSSSPSPVASSSAASLAAADKSVRVVFESALAEAVASVHVGHLASAEDMDVLAVTRCGRMRVFSTATRSGTHGLLVLDMPAADSSQFSRLLQRIHGDARQAPLTETEARRVGDASVQRIQDELVRLRARMADLKDMLGKEKGGRIAGRRPLSLSLRVLPIPDSAVCRLVLESEVPLDIVTIEASRPVLVEPTDQQLCILSLQPQQSPPLPQHGLADVDMLTPTPRVASAAPEHCAAIEGPQCVASFRCAVQVRKVECRLRVTEGAACELRAFAVMKTDPVRCQVVATTLQPLCLHHAIPITRAAAALGTVTYARASFRGEFSARQAQTWLSKIFVTVSAHTLRVPGPRSRQPQPQPQMPAEQLYEIAYCSAFDTTTVVLSYGHGRVDLHAESLLTCRWLRDLLVQYAAADRVRAGVNMATRRSCVLSPLTKIKPLLHRALIEPQQVEIAVALRELQAHEPELLTYLEPAMVKVLEDDEASRSATDATLVDQSTVIPNVLGLFDAIFTMKGRLVDFQLRKKLEELCTVENYTAAALDRLFMEALSFWPA